ncbi:hypothetical protein [Frankia canadensis]|nr:hypothetical protein [Frankia canadensis]
MDVLPAFLGDGRVRLLFTVIDGSPFSTGADEFLADLGARVIPWEHAVTHRFDLAVAAGRSGPLHKIRAPLMVIPHGAGYNKFKQETGNRKQETGNRKQVYGFAPDQLLHEGRLVPRAVVLSHAEQFARLSRSCPEALPAAVVGGDPCFDRILASRHRRREFRGALGVDPGQKLVVLTSTWGRGSLLARAAELPARLLAELPVDEYRVVAAIHPNVWDWHGALEVRGWLAEAARAGLAVLPPREGWRAALVAADLAIGDHGSVGVYAAAIDRPVLLAAGDPAELDPAGSTARLLALAPTLRPAFPLRRQVDDAISGHTSGRYAELAAGTFALPGESLATLRRLLYGLLDLPEPATPARARALDPPTADGAPPTAVWVTTTVLSPAAEPAMGPAAEPAAASAAVAVHRRPAVADVPWYVDPPGTDRHLAVDIADTDPRLLESADVLLRGVATPGYPAAEWTADVLTDHPGCRLAADVTIPGRLALRPRGGPVLEFRHLPPTPAASVLASAAYAWIADGRPLAGLVDAGVEIRLGSRLLRIRGAAPSDDATPSNDAKAGTRTA